MKTIFYLILLCAITFINAEKNSRLNRNRGKPGKRGRITPIPCTFDKKSSTKKDSTGKKQRQSETCRPFWIIRRPMCRTGHNKRDICNKKFCWKVVDQKARTENPLIPKGDFLLVQARWAKTNRGDAESSYVSAPFRVSEKSKTKCLKFKHLMRAEPSESQKSRKKTNYPPLSMQLKVNILTSDKKTSEKPYTIWSREEAINGDQWIETNLNLLEELNELRPKKGRRISRRKQMGNKKKIRIQFQAIHAGASKEAFIAIDNIQFSNDCRSHPSRKKSPRPNNRQNNKSKGSRITSPNNEEQKPPLKGHKPQTDQLEIVLVDRSYMTNHAAAYRPKDEVMDMRFPNSSPSPSYLNSGYIYSPNHADYYDFERYSAGYFGMDQMQGCKYSNYAVDIGDCIKKFKNEMEVSKGYGTRQNMICHERYDDMVRCMKDCAFLCADRNGEESINSGSLDSGIDQILNNELHLRDSYCGDQTDVFPTFDVTRYGMDCPEDFGEGMEKCALKLVNSLQNHDNLCRDFHRASECKRDLLGKQCKFKSIENMLIFGVGIEVQNAYNPFCQNPLNGY